MLQYKMEEGGGEATVEKKPGHKTEVGNTIVKLKKAARKARRQVKKEKELTT